ncbi:MAG: hypothetical protein ABSF83_00280 [Nitrososphaerales archaeon]
MKSRWQSLGFDSETFKLFVKMRGARTRMSLLAALRRPRHRLWLAQELGLDWKVIDRNITLLNERGLVCEDVAFGKVKTYRRTAFGESLLQLLRELDGEIEGGPEPGGLEEGEEPLALRSEQGRRGTTREPGPVSIRPLIVVRSVPHRGSSG